MADLNCQIEIPQGVSTLNVGDKFALVCTGSEAENLNVEKAELRLEESDKYKLKIFKIEKSSGSLRAEATSYVVGDHQLKAIQLVDETHSLVLGDLSLSIKSVQNPQEPKQEPYGAFGPMVFIPYAFIYLVVLILLICLVPIVVKAISNRRRKKQMDQIHSKSFQSPPFQELHRVLRGLQRQHSFLGDPKAPVEAGFDLGKVNAEIDSLYRVYLARQFKLPAHVWSVSKICATLKLEQQSLDVKIVRQIGLDLEEIRRAKSGTKSLAGRDLYQVLNQVKKTSLDIDRSFKK